VGEGTVAIPHPVTPGAWIGNLQYFDGGKGYWYLVENAVSFLYNDLGLTRGDIDQRFEDTLYGYEYVQSSEQAFYFIEGIESADHEMSSEDWLLAYHGNRLVGKARWQGEYTSIPVMGDNSTEHTIGYCQSGDVPTFKLLNGFTGEVISLTGAIPGWSSNGIYLSGTLQETLNVPGAFVLNDIYPNPFNPVTTISYSIPEQAHVQVLVYDVMGRMIEQIVNEQQSEGTHFVNFDASGYSSGMYFVKLISGGEMITQKIMFMK